MLRLTERSDTVIGETGRAAPYHDVPVFNWEAADRIRAAFATPQEYGRNAEGNGNDRRPAIILVAILVEAKLRARDITIDEASVWIIIRKPCRGGCS
jgi:hypothetical protein